MTYPKTGAPVSWARRRRLVARRRLLRRVFDPGTVVTALLVGFIGYRIWPQLAAVAGVPTAGVEAPPFALTTLEGERVTLAQLRGRVVLLNFWATWCPPCRMEMPGFQRVYEKHRDAGFVIVGVSVDRGGSEPVRAFLSKRGITYPVAMSSWEVVRDYGDARVLPTSFLIDRAGRVRHEVQGLFVGIALEQAVERLLAEGTPPADAAPRPAAAAPAP